MKRFRGSRRAKVVHGDDDAELGRPRNAIFRLCGAPASAPRDGRNAGASGLGRRCRRQPRGVGVGISRIKEAEKVRDVNKLEWTVH